jgi:hypothetical protein
MSRTITRFGAVGPTGSGRVAIPTQRSARLQSMRADTPAAPAPSVSDPDLTEGNHPDELSNHRRRWGGTEIAQNTAVATGRTKRLSGIQAG